MSADAGGAATKSAIEKSRSVTNEQVNAQSKKLTITIVNHSASDPEGNGNQAEMNESGQKESKRKKRSKRKRAGNPCD